MLIGGLWHGAALKFIIWGALHGFALMVHKAWLKYARVDLGKFGKYIGVLVTFHFVSFCWMYFRAAEMATVGQMLSNVFTDFDLAGVASRVAAYWRVFTLMLIGYVVHLLPSNLKIGRAHV